MNIIQLSYDIMPLMSGSKALGDYSDGVPPLPIPNREVKPISANGTAFVGE